MQQNIDDEELRKRIEEAQRKVAAGEIDLRPIGEALFGKWDQDYIAATLKYARASLSSSGNEEGFKKNNQMTELEKIAMELENIARVISNCNLPECDCWKVHIQDASEVLNAPNGWDFSSESYHLITKIEALRKAFSTRENKNSSDIQILIRTELRKAFERGRRSNAIH